MTFISSLSKTAILFGAVAGLVFAPSLAASATGEPAKDEVAYYVYKKLDHNKPAAWENSGEQTLVAVQPGSDWFAVAPDLPDFVCGSGWAFQQDKVHADPGFEWPESITYPTDNIGWPPIYDAKHGELETSPCIPTRPNPIPWSDAGETFSCDAWTYWTKTGHYGFTFDAEANVWVQDAEPTVDAETSEVRQTTFDERQARGCNPELAETGSEAVALWIGVGASVVALGILLLVIRRVRND